MFYFKILFEANKPWRQRWFYPSALVLLLICIHIPAQTSGDHRWIMNDDLQIPDFPSYIIWGEFETALIRWAITGLFLHCTTIEGELGESQSKHRARTYEEEKPRQPGSSSSAIWSHLPWRQLLWSDTGENLYKLLYVLISRKQTSEICTEFA